MRHWKRITLGALSGPIAMAVVLAPIELVYRMGGSLSQAMLAEAALFLAVAGSLAASALLMKS